MILLGKAFIIILIVTIVLVGVLIALYFWGNKLQEKQLEQREQINAASQPATIFIIDKKIMPMKDAKLPKAVMDQAPKRYQKAKIPVVKAKAGPQVLTLICDESIYDDVPKHGEVKVMLSGIYITSVKTLHKGAKKQLQMEAEKPRKKTFRERLMKKQSDYQKQLDYELATKKSKEEIKKEKAEEKKRREREKKITV